MKKDQPRYPSWLPVVVTGAMAVAVIWVGVSLVCARQAFREPSTGRVPTPVARLALRFRLLHPRPDGIYAGETLEGRYAHWFFNGFTCGKGCGTSNGTTLEADAYMAGVSYRAEHPEDDDLIMSGYGYQRLKADGIWSQAMEKSTFAPESAPGEVWWLGYFEKYDAVWKPRTSGLPIPSSEDVRVHINGYLSPEGHYGHLASQSAKYWCCPSWTRRNDSLTR